MSGTDRQTLDTQTDASLKSDSAKFASDHGGITNSGIRGAADSTTASDSQSKTNAGFSSGGGMSSSSGPGTSTSSSGLNPGQPLQNKGAGIMKDADDAGMESHAKGFSMLDQAKEHLGIKEKK